MYLIIVPQSQIKNLFSKSKDNQKQEKNKKVENQPKKPQKKVEKLPEPSKPKPPKSIESALNYVSQLGIINVLIEHITFSFF